MLSIIMEKIEWCSLVEKNTEILSTNEGLWLQMIKRWNHSFERVQHLKLFENVDKLSYFYEKAKFGVLWLNINFLHMQK